MRVLIIILICSCIVFPQKVQQEKVSNTVKVYPHVRQNFPPEIPIVYYPISGLSFSPSNIKITVLKDDQGKPGKTINGGQSKKELEEVGVGESIITHFEITHRDVMANNGAGFPGYIFANLEFTKPGYRYEITLKGSTSLDQTNYMRPVGLSFKSPYFGQETFIVEVAYPSKADKEFQLLDAYYFGETATIPFSMDGIPRLDSKTGEDLYSYKVFIDKKVEKEGKGSSVGLSDILKNEKFIDKDINVEGYYRGQIIKYDDGSESRWRTSLRLKQGEVLCETKWVEANTGLPVPTLNITNKENLTFKFKLKVKGFEKLTPLKGIKSQDQKIRFNNKAGLTPLDKGTDVGPDGEGYYYMTFSYQDFKSAFGSGTEVLAEFYFFDSAGNKFDKSFLAKIEY